MTTRERIQAEADRVNDQRDLDQLYGIVKEFAESKRRQRQSLMSKLRNVTIDAPEDFSTNFDLYLTGEKRAEPDFR